MTVTSHLVRDNTDEKNVVIAPFDKSNFPRSDGGYWGWDVGIWKFRMQIAKLFVCGLVVGNLADQNMDSV